MPNLSDVDVTQILYNSITTNIQHVLTCINQVPNGLTMLNLSPTSPSARQSWRTCRVLYDGPPSLHGASRRLCGNCRWPPSRGGLVMLLHFFTSHPMFYGFKMVQFLGSNFPFFGGGSTIEMIKCWRLCQSAVGEPENPPKLFGRHIPHLRTPPCKFLHDCLLSSALN